MRYIRFHETFISLIFFVIWPFGALIVALNRYKLRESKLIVYLFIIFFGFTFVYSNEDLDSSRYAEYFTIVAKLNYSEFVNSFFQFSYLTEGELDFAKPIFAFMSSRFSNDPRVYFGLISIFFGYFYLKSVSLFYNIYQKSRSLNTLFFLIFFTFILNPVFNINGFRFYTAVWIFFYGTYYFVYHNKRKYMGFCFLSVFFHFSFIIPVFILLLYNLIGIKNKLYYLFFILSLIVSEAFIGFSVETTQYLPTALSEKSNVYLNIDSYAVSQTRGILYVIIVDKAIKFYFLILFFHTRIKSRKIIRSLEVEKIYSFSLLFIAVSNVISIIPSVGRFTVLFYMFALLYVVLVYQHLNIKKINWLIFLGVFPFLMGLSVVLKLGMDVTNPYLLTLLPFPYIFDQISIMELLF